MPTFFNEIDISPTLSSTWNRSIDISSHVPTNVGAVFLKIVNTGALGTSYTLTTRGPDDSTSSYHTSGYGGNGLVEVYTQLSQIIRMTSDRYIIYYNDYTANMKLYIYGYLTNEEIATKANPTVINPGTPTATWNTIDLAPYISAYTSKPVYGAVFRLESYSSAGGKMIISPPGSSFSDTYVGTYSKPFMGSAAVKFNSANGYQLRFWSDNALSRFYLVGLLTQDIIQTENSERDITPASASVWTDAYTLPTNAVAGIYAFKSAPSRPVSGIRPKSSPTIEFYGLTYGGMHNGCVPVGTGKTVQAFISDTAATTKIYQTGYWKLPPGGEFFNGVTF